MSSVDDAGSRERLRSAGRRLRRVFILASCAAASLVVAATFVELGAALAWKVTHGFRSAANENPMFRSPSFSGVSWAPGLLEEERSRWIHQRGEYVPFRLWGVARWHGSYVNTDDTPHGTWRHTVNPTRPDCQGRSVKQIWVLGGSTVYGTGAADGATLPSYLSAALNSSKESCVEVTNLGAEGYVTNQEVMLVMERLKAGLRPDDVIFYDGVNEAYVGAVSPGIPAAHASLDRIQMGVENRFRNKLDFLYESYSMKLVGRLLGSLGRANTKPPLSADQLAVATLANYEANLALVTTLAHAYGFHAHFFWQPSMFFGRKPLDWFEQDIFRSRSTGTGEGFGTAFAAVYAVAATRAASTGSFVFLGDLFDGVKDSVYLDGWMHLGPRGNEMVARAIADAIQRHD